MKCLSPLTYDGQAFHPFRSGRFSLSAQLTSQNPTDKARHDYMVALVTQMLDLNKWLQDVRVEQEKTQLSRQIEVTDAAIDKLVYELYGLTAEEIAIVEARSSK